MTLDAPSYFDHIKAYLSDKYIIHRGEGGEIVLTEKYFREGETKKSTRIVRLPYKGKAFAIKLDGHEEPLFHFLDNNGKEVSATASPYAARLDGWLKRHGMRSSMPLCGWPSRMARRVVAI